MTVAQATKQALHDLGKASIGELAAEIGADERQRPAMGHALRSGLGVWAERVGRGQYVWLNGSKSPAPATSAELQPLIDRIGDDAFGTVGLTYVGRAQDGAFICTDQNDVVWRVEVTATARLI